MNINASNIFQVLADARFRIWRNTHSDIPTWYIYENIETNASTRYGHSEVDADKALALRKDKFIANLTERIHVEDMPEVTVRDAKQQEVPDVRSAWESVQPSTKGTRKVPAKRLGKGKRLPVTDDGHTELGSGTGSDVGSPAPAVDGGAAEASYRCHSTEGPAESVSNSPVPSQSDGKHSPEKS